MLLHTDAFRRKPFYTQKLPPQFLTLGHHFARKGCASTSEIAISPQFLTPDHHFTCEIAILLHVWTSKRMNQSSRPPMPCCHTKSTTIPQFSTIEPHFVRRGCVSCRLVGTAPRLKREIEKKEKEEGKGARGQESKRARAQEGKRECEDVKM